MSQFANPTGFFGKILAKGMAWGHKDFYKNTAKALNLKHDDKYLEIGFGSGLFIKKYVSNVSRIAGRSFPERPEGSREKRSAAQAEGVSALPRGKGWGADAGD